MVMSIGITRACFYRWKSKYGGMERKNLVGIVSGRKSQVRRARRMRAAVQDPRRHFLTS